MKINKRLFFLPFISFCFIICYANKTPWDEDKSDWSRLMKLTYHHKYNRMKSLLKKNVDINYESKSGLNVFDIVMRNKDTVGLKILMQFAKTASFDTCALLAEGCRFGGYIVVNLLFKYGLKIQEDTSTDCFLLIEACKYGTTDLVNLLILNGSQVNCRTKADKMTPLMYAVLSGNIEMVKLLLSNGANKSYKTETGKSALDYVGEIPSQLHVTDYDKNILLNILK